MRVGVKVSSVDPEALPAVIEAAAGLGLDVRWELGVLGVVVGTVNEGEVEALREIPGVASVELETSVSAA